MPKFLEICERATRGITVEAEVGHIGGTEDEINADIAYAKLDDCEELVKNTPKIYLSSNGTPAFSIAGSEPVEDWGLVVGHNFGVRVNEEGTDGLYVSRGKIANFTIDKNKLEANVFLKNIKVGKKCLIYTKTDKGKKILLK